MPRLLPISLQLELWLGIDIVGQQTHPGSALPHSRDYCAHAHLTNEEHSHVVSRNASRRRGVSIIFTNSARDRAYIPYVVHPIELRKRRGQSETMPKRMLVVDDSSPVLNSIKFMLESVPDWVVDGGAHDGREAIEKVALLNPDLVLLDLSMPVMN